MKVLASSSGPSHWTGTLSYHGAGQSQSLFSQVLHRSRKRPSVLSLIVCSRKEVVYKAYWNQISNISADSISPSDNPVNSLMIRAWIWMFTRVLGRESFPLYRTAYKNSKMSCFCSNIFGYQGTNFHVNYSFAKIFYLHLNPLNTGFVEQNVSLINSTYIKGDRLTNQSAIQCLYGFTAFHSHVSKIWLRNYR